MFPLGSNSENLFMLNLHIANKNYSSWSLRPWVLMRALDIPFVENCLLLAKAHIGMSFVNFLQMVWFLVLLMVTSRFGTP
ncbi:MAG: hypothetical protein ACI9XU_001274 [Arenicella sp.]|jgi:hypothetical protein